VAYIYYMKNTNTFTPVDTFSRSQIVFTQIRDAIFSGKLKPGDPLRELHLANDFKVSQATIREALLQLEKYGLVTRLVQKGTTVINMSEQEISERLITRFQLEELACIEASKNMGAEDYQNLSDLDSKINKAAKKNQYFELITADLNFHKLIWDKSGNKILSETLERLTLPIFAFFTIQHSAKSSKLEPLVNPHAKIIEALKSKNPDKIKKVLNEDKKQSYGQYL
jgi:DNA-binding GntR family transcriptional regulator